MAVSIFYYELNQDKVNKAWDELIHGGFELPVSTIAPGEIQDEFDQIDEERILKELFREDTAIIDKNSGAKFSVPLNMQDEDVVAWLLQAVLGINIEEEDFFRDNAVAGIPLELWTRLFQTMSPEVMETVKAKCKKAGYSFDKFREYLRGVKSIVKYCLDNHSDMIVFYEGAPSGIMRERAERMRKLLVRGVEKKNPDD